MHDENTDKRFYSWAIPLVQGLIYGAPALMGFIASLTLLKGHTLTGLLFVLMPIAYAAWYAWDVRYGPEDARELLEPMAKAWAAGLLFGGIVWIAISGAMRLTQSA